MSKPTMEEISKAVLSLHNQPLLNIKIYPYTLWSIIIQLQVSATHSAIEDNLVARTQAISEGLQREFKSLPPMLATALNDGWRSIKKTGVPNTNC